MKNPLITGMVVFLSASLFQNGLHAQIAAASRPDAKDPIVKAAAALVSDPVPNNSNPVSGTMVSPRAMKSFRQNFKNAGDATWYENGNSYIAKYLTHGRPSRTAIQKNGYVLYSIIYGTEKDLPDEARRIIKANYLDFEIGNVSEVESMGLSAFIINISKDNELYTLRFADGGLDELSHYKNPPGHPVNYSRNN